MFLAVMSFATRWGLLGLGCSDLGPVLVDGRYGVAGLAAGGVPWSRLRRVGWVVRWWRSVARRPFRSDVRVIIAKPPEKTAR